MISISSRRPVVLYVGSADSQGVENWSLGVHQLTKKFKKFRVMNSLKICLH